MAFVKDTAWLAVVTASAQQLSLHDATTGTLVQTEQQLLQTTGVTWRCPVELPSSLAVGYSDGRVHHLHCHYDYYN